jgi:hypothetical protein
MVACLPNRESARRRCGQCLPSQQSSAFAKRTFLPFWHQCAALRVNGPLMKQSNGFSAVGPLTILANSAYATQPYRKGTVVGGGIVEDRMRRAAGFHRQGIEANGEQRTLAGTHQVAGWKIAAIEAATQLRFPLAGLEVQDVDLSLVL